MPAIAALTLADGQATPVNHTFNVGTTNGSKAEWQERSSSLPAGYFVITDEVRKPASPGAAYRRIIGFNIPVTATVDGSLKVVRFNSGQVILNFSESSTEQERKDQLAYMTNFLLNASVKAAVPALEPFY